MSKSHLLIGALAISVGANVVQFVNGEKDHLNKAALKLSAFGAELGKISKEMPLTEEQKNRIRTLAQIPLPVPKTIANNVVLTHGTNFDSSEPVVLQSTTGREIKSCGKVKADNDSVDICDIKVLNPSKFLRHALTVSEPIEGKILKNNKEVPAKFIVEVTTLWKGSQCSAMASIVSGFVGPCAEVPKLN